MLAFFKNLHIDLNVAIERRENFDAINRETISVQNIDFFDVAIDEINDTLSENSRTHFDVEIERDKSFDDVNDEKIIDRNDETDDSEICAENETIDFDFLT